MSRRAERQRPPVPPPGLPPGRVLELPGRGEVFYRHHRTGDLARPTVVLLHGWTATADLQWFTAYEALASRYDVVALDLRGHGRGLRTEEPFSLEDAADDVASLVQRLGLRHVILVGYSMGGPIALHTAARHPGVASGLVGIATALEFRDSLGERVRWRLLFLLETFLRSRASAVLVRSLERRIERDHPELAPWVPWLAGESRRGDPRALTEAGRALGRYDARSWAASLEVPSAVVVTTADDLVVPRRQRALAAALEASVFELDGDHFANLFNGQGFAATTLRAVDDVAARLRTGSTARRSA